MEENKAQEEPPAGFGDLPVELVEKIVTPLDAIFKRSLRLTSRTLKEVVERCPITYHQVKITLAYDMGKIQIEMMIDEENRLELEFEKTETGVVIRNPSEGWEKVENNSDPKRRLLEKASEHFLKIFLKDALSVKKLVFHFKSFGPLEVKNSRTFDTVFLFQCIFTTLLEQSNRKFDVEHVQFLHDRETGGFVKKFLPHLKPEKLKKITWFGDENASAIGSMEQLQKAEEFVTDSTGGVEVFANSLHSRIVRGDALETEIFFKKLVPGLTTIRGQWRTINIEFRYCFLIDQVLRGTDDQTPLESRRPNTKLLKIQDSNDFVRIEFSKTNAMFTKVTGC